LKDIIKTISMVCAVTAVILLILFVAVVVVYLIIASLGFVLFGIVGWWAIPILIVGISFIALAVYGYILLEHK